MSSLNPSQVIKGRWRLTKKIGQGAFGEIYQARNVITGEDVAIKLERVDTKKQVLKLEVAVLKKLQDCAYVCRFITCGRFSDYNYMVMELLGENLSELRRRQPEGKFGLATTLKLGIQMLKATEAVHQLGYLHRDIKPSNFAIGLGTKKRSVFIIDFGLARRFLTPGSQNDIRPARETTGFRGTARYASINSHLSRDLGRRDDLWSLFYVLIEFAKGSLPWRKLKDKDEIGEMKIQHNNLELLKDLPSEFLSFMQHLQGLQYGDKPDYQYLLSLLRDLYYKIGANERTPYDWEVSPGAASTTPATSAASANAPTAVTSNNPNVNPSSLSNGSTSPPIGSVKPDSMISLGGVSLASASASGSPIFTPHGSRNQIHHVNSSTSIGTQEEAGQESGFYDFSELQCEVLCSSAPSDLDSKKMTNNKVGIPDLSGRQYVSSNLDVLASEGNALNSSGSSQKQHKRSGSAQEQDLSSGNNNNDNNSVANMNHHSAVSDNKSKVTSDEDKDKDKGISPAIREPPRKQKLSTRSDTRSHNSASYNDDIEDMNNAIYSDEAENMNNSTASGNKNRKASNTNTVEKQEGEKEDDDTRTQEYKEEKPKKRKKKSNTQDGEKGVQPKTRSKSRSKLIDSDKEAKKSKKKKKSGKKKKGSSKDSSKSKPKPGTHQQFESMEVEQTDPKEKTNENPTAATQNTQTDHLPSRKDSSKKCVGCTIM